MLKDKLTLAEMDILEEALDALGAAERHFKLRDQSNAGLHLTPVKWSPITRLVSKSTASLDALLAIDEEADINHIGVGETSIESESN